MGIDYDGSKSADSDIFVAYGLEKYVAAVVHAVKDVCNCRNVKHPVICSESGRDIMSYHSILIFEAIGASTNTAPSLSSIGLQYLATGLSEQALRGYLQHRGQEGAGIVTVNNNLLQSIIGVGLVSDVFNESKLDQLPGSLAIGHVRYSTAGQYMLKNIQPFVVGYHFGSVGVAHNGNLVNYRTLRAKLEETGSIFNNTYDTEIVLHLISTSKHRPFILRTVDACEKFEGTYSVVFVTEDKLVAVRDPFGFRPMVMGRISNGAVVFASETCALDLFEAHYERKVFPGEVVVVDDNGIQSFCLMSHPQPKQCIFEHNYFALPNSVDFKGKPVLKQNIGNWKACLFILGNECGERLAYYGIAKNIVTYLTRKLHQGNVSAARNVTTWKGTCYLSPLIGAVLVDSYWGAILDYCCFFLLFISLGCIH
ncbi:amidophosphoribosyltransferase, chloroplastic-like [Vicia villosa]|uniref:amidophosphoribosyltransferase, chloroplastic-like n=1 Tax=Vicia villosa TaxID=3911 RepID=UPI00273AACB2|nr:amidophosphoribosyltransferase, chloroplastic-like [Vicia villosa]